MPEADAVFAKSARCICNLRAFGYVAGMNTKERISEVIEHPEQLQELAETVQEQGKQWLSEADEFIRRNPYLALGIALAAGCALASLLRNRE
jgi:ElaB/YqjD/DUF883 family membrane-anchored ribosome-binding protein